MLYIALGGGGGRGRGGGDALMHSPECLAGLGSRKRGQFWVRIHVCIGTCYIIGKRLSAYKGV